MSPSPLEIPAGFGRCRLRMTLVIAEILLPRDNKRNKQPTYTCRRTVTYRS